MKLWIKEAGPKPLPLHLLPYYYKFYCFVTCFNIKYFVSMTPWLDCLLRVIGFEVYINWVWVIFLLFIWWWLDSYKYGCYSCSLYGDGDLIPIIVAVNSKHIREYPCDFNAFFCLICAFFFVLRHHFDYFFTMCLKLIKQYYTGLFFELVFLNLSNIFFFRFSWLFTPDVDYTRLLLCNVLICCFWLIILFRSQMIKSLCYSCEFNISLGDNWLAWMQIEEVVGTDNHSHVLHILFKGNSFCNTSYCLSSQRAWHFLFIWSWNHEVEVVSFKLFYTLWFYIFRIWHII